MLPRMQVTSFNLDSCQSNKSVCSEMDQARRIRRRWPPRRGACPRHVGAVVVAVAGSGALRGVGLGRRRPHCMTSRAWRRGGASWRPWHGGVQLGLPAKRSGHMRPALRLSRTRLSQKAGTGRLPPSTGTISLLVFFKNLKYIITLNPFAAI